MKIVCLGDSLTGPSPGTPYLDKFIKWSDLLQFGLDILLGEGKITVMNHGKAGDTSIAVRQDLKARLLDCHPDIVIILLGSNNYSPQNWIPETPAIFRNDLTDIVRKSKAAGIRVLLLLYPHPKAENMEKVWIHGNLGNPVIMDVAQAEDVPVLNLQASFDEASKTQSLAELVSPVDGVHLSPGGELVLTRAVFRKLRELDWIPFENDALSPIRDDGQNPSFAFAVS